ncbi:1-phosphofructokinase family hexose kinase [Brevibacillus fulvus]|uniref:Tagatose-6-phosphate kinase n=1 Tax=Brevibacillus fulvus TaxID=1125967 RepID=A0A938XYB5_9BACL|nr:1-phosphofructokinase family hexose kinase [Brevibacillus fulvus]
MIYTVTLNPAIDLIIRLEGIMTRKKNNRIFQKTQDIGGKATHVSVVLSTLGVPNIATGFIGADNQEILLTLLAEKGVRCQFVSQPSSATRTSIILLDQSGEGSYMLTEPGFQAAPETMQRLLQFLQNNVQEGDWVVFSGSPPQAFSVSDYAALLESVSQRRGRLVVDVSGAYLREALRVQPFMIKPNEFELEQLLGRRLRHTREIVWEVERLMKQGIRLVIVSMGKNGSMVGYDKAVYKITPPMVEEVNDTGCGDVFVGGVIAKLYQNSTLEEAIRFATALSATKAAQKGSSDFSLELAESWQSAVRIEQIGGVDR